MIVAFALLWGAVSHAAPVISEPPSPVWSVPLPGKASGAANHAERSTPVATDDGLLLGVDSDTGLFLVSKIDGRVLRMYPSEASVQGSALVLEDRIVFGDGAGQTYCYRHDGTLIWTHSSGAPILSTPAVAQGMVYVTNVKDLTVALNAETGALEWQYQRPADAGRQTELALFSAPMPLLVNKQLITGYSDGFLVGLNAATGDVLWDTQVGEGRYPDIVGTPVANETDVFASGYFGPLLAIDSQTRNVRWRVEAGAAATSTLMKVEAGEHLLHPGSDGTLRCIDTLTGGQVWSWSSGSNGALTRPHVTDAGILFGATDGGLYLVDPKTGEEIWRARYEFLLEGVTAAPLVSGRDVFYTSNAGNLYKMTAFDDDHMNATRTASGWTRIQR